MAAGCCLSEDDLQHLIRNLDPDPSRTLDYLVAVMSCISQYLTLDQRHRRERIQTGALVSHHLQIELAPDTLSPWNDGPCSPFLFLPALGQEF